MKRIILLCLLLFTALMVYATTVPTVIQYHDETFAWFSRLPTGQVTEWAERFTATANIASLDSTFFYLYLPIGTYTSITAKVYSATATTPPLPNALLGSVTVPASAYNAADNYTAISLSSLGLSFRSGDEFFISYSIDGGAYSSVSPYSTTGGLGILATAYGTSSNTRGVRYRRPTLTDPYVWSVYAGYWNLGISAFVQYEISHDVALTNVNFFGTYTLPLTDMPYECTVSSIASTETNVPVRLQVFNADTNALLFTDIQTIPTLTVATPVTVTFNPYTYSAAGRYNVVINTQLATDQISTNNSYMFEQQAIANYPATITYDDGACDNAYVLTNTIDGGFVSWFAPPYLPYQVTKVRYFLYDSTWPVPGGNEFRVVIFDDDGTGGGPGTELYNQVVTGVRGQWNEFDVTNSNIVLQDGSFFVGYIFTQIGTASPGIGCDTTAPVAGEGVTYEWIPPTLYLTGITTSEFMINATVEYPKPTHVAITKEVTGNKVAWDAIATGGLYTYTYDVKSGDSPASITNLEATTSDNFWTDTDTASGKKFYNVKATSAALKGSYVPREVRINAKPVMINAGATLAPLHFYELKN